jgi:UDP:flavonoid glycosyltransferase YjiC (YdhE family)
MAEFRSGAAVVEQARVLVASIGSLGDLHPVLAMGLELQRRGHSVTVASSEFYRSKVEALGLAFHPLRPNWDPTDPELIARCEDMRTGPEVLVRELVLPHLRETCEDLLVAAANADVMIAAELLFAAPLAAEKLGIPWASAILSPCSFLSVYDPSLLANIPEAYKFRKAGPLVNRAILEMGRLGTRHWWQPVRDLRKDLGIRVECEPIFRDKFSPDLVLALFSHVLAEPQLDWPKQTVQPGFIFFDRHGHDSPEIADFLSSGEPPIVFTLGSAAVHNPGSFYEASQAAAQQLGRRALLVGGKDRKGIVAPGIFAVPYARYSQIFPFSAAVVHQGGSGTTGQALRAGRPQLIVPYGWDQPDNGARVERMGGGLVLERTQYRAETAAAKLRLLLEDSRFAARAGESAAVIQSEDALAKACDAVEMRIPVRG